MSEPVPKIRITAHDIARAIRKKLESEKGNGRSKKWAVFEEVRFGSGFAGYPNRREEFSEIERVGSRIDVFAMCTWPSSDFLRRAYEIKVARSDLKAEFDNPDKRAPWLEVVHEFYIAAAVGLTSPEEVEDRAPECGLIVYDPTRIVRPRPGEWRRRADSGLRVVRAPMRLDGGEPSWRLVASILRSVGA